MSYVHAKRYAQALFELTREKDSMDAVHADMDQLLPLIRTVPALDVLFASPAIPTEKRSALIHELFDGKIDAVTLQFLCFLEHKKRLFLVKPIGEHYQYLYRQYKNQKEIYITARAPLSNPQIDAICRHFSARLDKEMVPVTDIDPALRGGVKCLVGNTVYDYTINAQLKRYHERVIHAA